MTNKFNQYSLDVTLSSTDEITDICSPLKKHLGVDNFSYIKIFSDMSRIHLDTDPVWTEFFYSKIEEYHQGNLTEAHHWKTGFAHLHELGDSCIADSLEYDVGDGMVLSQHNAQENYTELFFMTHKWSIHRNNKVNFLLRNMDLIELFTDYFRDAASKIITDAEKSPIILPFVEQSDTLTMPTDAQIRAAFTNDIKKLTQKKQLSQRELDCIYYSSLDMTAKQVAEQLLISPKTVERHLENAKNKIGVRKKSSLIKACIH